MLVPKLVLLAVVACVILFVLGVQGSDVGYFIGQVIQWIGQGLKGIFQGLASSSSNN